MIPQRLTFAGIRDYPPSLVDLSGKDDHVMITGPNGAGKSTLTFCMGAVLYSSKVDLEGLKSRNLPPDQTWKASISMLFQNDGLMKIDAPAFIEFTLKIEQAPGQPIKKEFSVSTSDVIDQWETTIKYTSGDRYYNLSAYKKDLQYKYKIDPDLFYLIWYQQEVNQFAVMDPEERFRIFSEMHGIDKAQHDWEESMERVKETKETLHSAETNVKRMKSELSIKKTALDRYEDNQKRLSEGGSLYIESLMQLEVHYKKEIHNYEEIILELAADMEESKHELQSKEVSKEENKQLLTSLEDNEEETEIKINESASNIEELKEHIRQIETQVEVLEKELEGITQRKNQINRTEEEVKAGLLKLGNEQAKTNHEYEEMTSELSEKNQAWQTKVELIANMKQQIAADEKLELTHTQRLKRYKGSYHMHITMNELDRKIGDNKDRKLDLARSLNELQQEMELLEEERDLSARQMESIKYFRNQHIKAFPLRELIELDDAAELKDEQLFDAIKYTIFFNEKHANPPNDLYHVPLMKVIPEKSVTELPWVHLQIKKDIQEVDISYAMKALWWVKQFFEEGRKTFSIESGMLIDPMGIRGPQERDRFILSVKALQIRKQELKQQAEKCTFELDAIEKKIQADIKTLQESNSVIQQVREAEAFMTNEHQRVEQKAKLQEELKNQKNIKADVNRLEAESSQLMRLQVEQETFENQLREEAAIYEELGKMKGKYNQLHELKQQWLRLKDELQSRNKQLEKLEDDLDALNNRVKKTERHIRHLKDTIVEGEREITVMNNQIEAKNEQIDTAKHELVTIMKELTELKNVIPSLYSEIVDTVPLDKLPSVPQIKQNRENGKIKLDHARTEDGIDPAAPENYQTAKLEYERSDGEYKRTKILLDQDVERTEELRDKLETTINMRVLELQQRFKSYMSMFQFEGEISWESYEDRRQRVRFKLYIKARKEGHQGTMEDVSVKARNGKVGKGVSGGEESLSSLLFALVLLQNLQTTPGFIVLDEFDSALDEDRKLKVFDLYERELKRKLIILTPKSHENSYFNKFQKAYVVHHDPTIPRSKVIGLVHQESIG